MTRKQTGSRGHLFLETLEDRLCLSAMPVSGSLVRPDATTQAHVSAAYGQLPLSFEANTGQTDAQVNFQSRGSGYTLFLTPVEAMLSLASGTANNIVRMHIVGADPNAHSTGMELQAGRTNYLVGSDPFQWHTDVINYGKVEYQNVYSGINLVYYGNQRQLEYDFVVAPGADTNTIRLDFDGVQSMILDAGGNLILHTAGGELVKNAPVVYQEIDGVRHTIAGHYLLEDGQVRFDVGSYDHTLPLVIDPILSYSTYLGGSGNDFGYSIAVDNAGSAYVTGYTVAANFPTKSPWQPKNGGGQDVFVTKMNPTGTGLVYSTYLGGSDNDIGRGIAIDGAGNAYVAGYTVSTNFPTTANAYQSSRASGLGINGYDAFVVKLATNGGLLYSTYLGGSAQDQATGIAVDAVGNAFVSGWTVSTDFPTTPGSYHTTPGGSVDGFVAKLNTTAATGSASLVYSTYLGGTGYDKAYGIAVDNSGSAYVTGVTGSTDFSLAGFPLQTGHGGGIRDAFVTKVNATGSNLDYSTYLGGSGDDIGNAIAVNKNTGEAYVLGSTTSANFPVVNAYQSTYAGGGDAFVSRLNATGSVLAYSTYLGGTGWDGGNDLNIYGGIGVDTAGNAYVSSVTTSSNFPTKNPLTGQGTYHGNGMNDVVVAKIDTSSPVGSTSLVYSTYLGGGDEEEAFGLAVDTAGNVYVTGETQSNDFPVIKGSFQRSKSGGIHVTEAFVTRISGAALMAASNAPALSVGTTTRPVTLTQLQPLLVEAISRWKSAGFDVTLLKGINLQIADLPGNTLGQAQGNTITLDTNAAGWGWFVDKTPGNDSEFRTRGNQGEQGSMDLLTVLEHEVGHMLGYDHQQSGVMVDTLFAGIRRLPTSDISLPDHISADWRSIFGVLHYQQSRKSW